MHMLAKLCKDECPYVAPHPELNCVFTCTTPDGCSKVNTEFAFPNSSSHVCERCNIVGCRTCSSQSQCLECFPDFQLDRGNTFCTYVWDEHAAHSLGFAVPLAVALLLLVAVVLTLVDYCCGRGLTKEAPNDQVEGEAGLSQEEEPEPTSSRPSSPHPGANGEDPMSSAIMQGKWHRLRCKLKDLTPDSEGRIPWKMIDFYVDLRSRFLVGVGLPLFHQWYYFLFLYSALMCAGTALVYRSSGLDGVLQKTGLVHATGMLLGDTGLQLCGLRSRRDMVWEAVRNFAALASVGYLALWVLGLVLSLLHAARQKSITAEFYKEHHCLAEFALNIEGFPPEANDEAKICSFLRGAFNNDALEVSVCYDFRHLRDRVQELAEKIIVQEDVTAGYYHPSLDAYQGAGLSDEDKAEVRDWLKPGAVGGLRNAGSVFAIFPHNYDLQNARRTFDSGNSVPLTRIGRAQSSSGPRKRPLPLLPHSPTPEWLPDRPDHLKWIDDRGHEHLLRIRDVLCEPPEVIWEHHGQPTASFVFRLLLAYSLIAASFAFLAFVIFIPLAAYSLKYMYQAGSTPTGLMMTLLGLLNMVATWVILLFHIRMTSFVGFVRRDREGRLIFGSWTLQCLVSFIFNVAISIFPPPREGDPGAADPSTVLLHHFSKETLDSIRDVTFQVRTSVRLFHILVPGGLFLGYLLFPLQGFVWPMTSALGGLRCWYGRFGRRITARQAELNLQPLGLSLGHDYMGHVFQPISCSLMLFFATGITWQTFIFLALWSLFMMPLSRYIHLRLSKRCFFTTNRIDTDALVAWGFPLSMVLAASCFWAARLRGWPMETVPCAFFVGFAAYTWLLVLCVRPHHVLAKDESSASQGKWYDDVRRLRYYDWHNCNPIKVLLSHCSDDPNVVPLVPFEVGKEHLQVESLARQMAKRARVLSTDHIGLQRSGPSGSDTPAGWLRVPEFEIFVDPKLLHGPQRSRASVSRRVRGNAVSFHLDKHPPDRGREPVLAGSGTDEEDDADVAGVRHMASSGHSAADVAEALPLDLNGWRARPPRVLETAPEEGLEEESPGSPL